MNKSLKQRKWLPSFILLVNILAGLGFPAKWSTLRVLFWTHSQIEFSWSSMWQVALEIMLCDHFTQVWLLLYEMMGEDMLLQVWPLSETLRERFQKSTTFF